MNETIRVIMKRDDLSEFEAEQRFYEVKEMIYDALDRGENYEYMEDLLVCELGLEPDYFMDFL